MSDEFTSSSDEELADLKAANAQAMAGALALGCEQVLGGKPFFAAEVTVDGGGTRQRFMVSIGTSPLKA